VNILSQQHDTVELPQADFGSALRWSMFAACYPQKLSGRPRAIGIRGRALLWLVLVLGLAMVGAIALTVVA
jgi:hypothetical protein